MWRGEGERQLKQVTMGKLRTLTADNLKGPWEVVCDGVVIARIVPEVTASQKPVIERAASVGTSEIRSFPKSAQASKRGFNA